MSRLTRGFPWIPAIFQEYYPVGGRIWYPATGLRDATSGAPANVGSYGYSWSETGYSSAAGRYLRFVSGGVAPNFNSYRAYGIAARCVAE